MRLLDEMSSLADGDLTVETTVTEDVTGAIADSVNFAVEALRDLVSGVNSTARQVAAFIWHYWRRQGVWFAILMVMVAQL